MEQKRKMIYAAAGVLYLITILFALYFGGRKVEMQGQIEDLKEEKDELQIENYQLVDEVWHLNQVLMDKTN